MANIWLTPLASRSMNWMPLRLQWPRSAIAQAVEDGVITQDQADRMAERAGNFGGRMPMMGGHGRDGFDKDGVDHEALLADELGDLRR